MIKRCCMCGKIIADSEQSDYYAYIRLKYCRPCAAEAHRMQIAASMRKLRAEHREAHKLTEESNALLKQENALLREAIHRLEFMLSESKHK